MYRYNFLETSDSFLIKGLQEHGKLIDDHTWNREKISAHHLPFLKVNNLADVMELVPRLDKWIKEGRRRIFYCTCYTDDPGNGFLVAPLSVRSHSQRRFIVL